MEVTIVYSVCFHSNMPIYESVTIETSRINNSGGVHIHPCIGH